MSPEPNRGKRNSSLNLPYVAQAIAELKGITAEEVIDVTRQNAEKLLGIHQYSLSYSFEESSELSSEELSELSEESSVPSDVSA